MPGTYRPESNRGVRCLACDLLNRRSASAFTETRKVHPMGEQGYAIPSLPHLTHSPAPG